jgi:hypothetical protein
MERTAMEVMNYLDDLFTEVFGECVVTMPSAWCPTCGQTGMTQDESCVTCNSPAFSNKDDYNAYVHG